MTFEKFFRLVSYAAVFCGFVALWVSGTFGPMSTMLFVGALIAGWLLEGSRLQVTEKIGTALIVMALPAYYVAWRYRLVDLQGGETAVAGILARMILSLTAIKLLQKKSDRDWIFLYMMSFFQVLLAAGLSISALYLAAFLVYLLVMVCAVIAFEIRKTARAVERKIAGESPLKPNEETGSSTVFPIRRLPTAAISLIVFTIMLATPLFFLLPRVGGAGFGGDQNGLRTSAGFSDTVRLGGIGRIQQSDEIAMRVKLEADSDTDRDLYFRGVALDTFDGHSWSKSKIGTKDPYLKGDNDLMQFDYATSRNYLTVQTVYLEPMDTQIVFALPRALAVQGNFPIVYRDVYGSLSYTRGYERTSYKVISDRSVPPPSRLRLDDQPYTGDVANYRTLPVDFDERITQLATKVTAGATNRYDKAKAIESYLQNNFGYTLDQKDRGSDPLANFLFDVREGHCEYFATAMAIMLRTQGVATRVVNGFHGGEYNDAADITVVRQRNAHAWVEVFFPKENVWVTFDPTPSSDETSGAATSGIAGAVHKYLEALETYWIQYFVAYDDQGQRSLAKSLRSGFLEYQNSLSSFTISLDSMLREWWSEVRGDKGLGSSAKAAGTAAGYVAAAILAVLFVIWVYRKLKRSGIFGRFRRGVFAKAESSAVEFYERMESILAERGMSRAASQTPLEFAYSTGLPATVHITEKYNRVRFGEKEISSAEEAEIEEWLDDLNPNEKG
jgi:hypothetical protein